jgi:hypothetical protein
MTIDTLLLSVADPETMQEEGLNSKRRLEILQQISAGRAEHLDYELFWARDEEVFLAILGHAPGCSPPSPGCRSAPGYFVSYKSSQDKSKMMTNKYNDEDGLHKINHCC